MEYGIVGNEMSATTAKPKGYHVYDERRSTVGGYMLGPLRRINYTEYKRAINLFGKTRKSDIYESMFYLHLGT